MIRKMEQSESKKNVK